MLCEFAHAFPGQLATLLDRDLHLKRNFREETATDLLMMGLVGLNSLDIKVFFPEEPPTGGDMEWIYAAPHEVGGGVYLRLIIQAKRAKYAKLKSGGYWYYDHLDHGSPPGQQAQTLVDYAASSPDGHATLPLYFFYHPASAIAPPAPRRPDVQGVNVVFADKVAPKVKGGCSKADKRLGEWRDHFFSLSDLLCWPYASEPAAPSAPHRPTGSQFLVGGDFVEAGLATPFWHPDLVADRLNDLIGDAGLDAATAAPRFVEPATMSDDIRRVVDGDLTKKERRAQRRTRVVLSTRLTRMSEGYEQNREALRGRRFSKGRDGQG
jgi:hypothetical protein